MAVLYAVADRVATITLDRPHRLNAYDVAMRDELWAALAAAADDPGVRVAILRGAGAAFCTGGDLAEFGTAPSPLVARSVRFARDVPGLLALPLARGRARHDSGRRRHADAATRRRARARRGRRPHASLARRRRGAGDGDRHPRRRARRARGRGGGDRGRDR